MINPPARALRMVWKRLFAGAAETAPQFCVTGHINGSYSLAAVNRALARSLQAACPGRVRLIPVEGSPTADLSGVPAAERGTIARLARRPWRATGPRVVISQHYPLHVPTEPCDLRLALFYWEETLVPPEFIDALNRGFDAVLAPSTFVATALAASGLAIPVHCIGQAPELAAFHDLAALRPPRAPTAPFTFLHVSSCLRRKGVDILLAGFARAFRRTDPVRLVIKGTPNPHNDVAAQIAALQAADPAAPAIELINQDLGREAFLALYRTADAMVLPTRGEGFNLPAAEAMAARLPLIVTGLGGQADFCTPATARLLEGHFTPSESHVAAPGAMWVEPCIDDLAKALHEIHAGGPLVASRVEQAETRIAAMTSPALVGRLEAVVGGMLRQASARGSAP